MRLSRPPALAATSGFRVDALDGHVGRVETPLFAGASEEPDYLVVRVGLDQRQRRLMIPTVFVGTVDEDGRTIVVNATANVIDGLPEHLPALPSIVRRSSQNACRGLRLRS